MNFEFKQFVRTLAHPCSTLLPRDGISGEQHRKGNLYRENVFGAMLQRAEERMESSSLASCTAICRSPPASL